jgi:hypothetical protein
VGPRRGLGLQGWVLIMSKKFLYEGREFTKDPAAGLVEGAELGPRVEDEWWYYGHPCYAYLEDRNLGGLKCDGLDSHNGLCAACKTELYDLLAARLELFDDVRETMDRAIKHHWGPEARL